MNQKPALVTVIVDGDRAVAVLRDGRREPPSHQNAAAELAALADPRGDRWIAWLDQRWEGEADPATWLQRARHPLDLRHAGRGSSDRSTRSLGYVDFDSPFLVPPAPGVCATSPLISPLAGIAHGAHLRAILPARSPGLAAALLVAGFTSLRIGGMPTADPAMLPPNAAAGAIPRRHLGWVIRRNWGLRWLLFWTVASTWDLRLALLPLLVGLTTKRGKVPANLAPGLPPPPPFILPSVPPTIDVILPTLGRPGPLADVLHDLGRQSTPVRRVLVVEQVPGHAGDEEWKNDLPDPSRPKVERLRIGQAGACGARNHALRRAASDPADWLLFLDDDVRLGIDFITALHRTATAHGVAVAQALVHLPSQDPERLRPATYPLLWPRFASGASLVATDAALAAGGFDPRLEGGYGEDYDYGLRLRTAGAETLLDPAITLLHLKAPSGGFRQPHRHPWHTAPGPPPRPSPTVMLSRLLHHTPEMIRGYQLFYVVTRLRSLRPWSWPRGSWEIARQWRSSRKWAARLERGEA